MKHILYNSLSTLPHHTSNAFPMWLRRMLGFTLSLLLLDAVQAQAVSNTWVGGHVGDPTSWKEAQNWSTGKAPVSTDDIFVNFTANNPIVDINTSIKSLTLTGSGATLYISSTYCLKASGNVTIATGTKLQSGTGMFMIGGGISGSGILDLSGNGTLQIAGDMTIDSLLAGKGGSSLVIFNGIAQALSKSYVFNNIQIGSTASPILSLMANEEIDGTLSGKGTVNCNSYNLLIVGDITVKNFNAGTSSVTLLGNSDMQSQDINSYIFYNLTVNNEKTYLMGNVTIQHNLNFINGNMMLRSYNLTIIDGASITWNGAAQTDWGSGYIVTSGKGYLTMTANPSGTIFPIGYTATDFNPITLTTDTGKAACNVLVASGITDASGAQIASHVVNETWTVISNSAVASMTMTPQWTDGSYGTSAQEQPQFDRSLAQISTRTSQATNAPWTPSGLIGQASGGNPWTKSSGKISMTAGATYFVGVGDIGSALPITLDKFDVANAQAHAELYWSTAMEINNNYFEVERSLSGLQWSSLGKVAGHGSSNEENAYHFIDSLHGIIGNTTVFYRLKQVDFNGSFTYSPIRSIAIANTPISVQTYPNPTQGTLNVAWENDNANTVLNIMNLSGNTLYAETIGGQGAVSRQISLERYPAGAYIVKLTTGENETSKIVYKN